MSPVTLCGHPLLQDRLGRLRDRKTDSERFRSLLEEAGTLLAGCALESLKLKKVTVKTPLTRAQTRRADQEVVLVAVLRAGLGLLPGALRLVPSARVGLIGIYRNEQTLDPVRYYVRLPKGLDRGLTLLLDPMLATGGSASEAIRILKSDGASRIVLVSLVAARIGIRRVQRDHPDVRIVTGAVDPRLNAQGYIVPGLGDAGDRLFGTT